MLVPVLAANPSRSRTERFVWGQFPPVRLSVREIKSFVVFSSNSVEEVFTKRCPASASFANRPSDGHSVLEGEYQLLCALPASIFRFGRNSEQEVCTQWWCKCVRMARNGAGRAVRFLRAYVNKVTLPAYRQTV